MTVPRSPKGDEQLIGLRDCLESGGRVVAASVSGQSDRLGPFDLTQHGSAPADGGQNRTLPRRRSPTANRSSNSWT